MRRTRLMLQTERNAPAEAEIASHRFLLRAGMIRKVAAGVYAYTPLGLRTLSKVMNIIRREMDAAGAQEVLLPALHPSDLWEKSGRWAQYGKEMMRLTDRHEREFALGPTAEELMTSIAAANITSYRQLPVNIYQIQSKYRDEIRPRFGLMRAREFHMKDAYSFDVDDAGLEASYQAMYAAYSRIFTACGVDFRPVKAATGLMGGAFSHEFHILAQSGEEELAHCTSCDYAANTEVATYGKPAAGGVAGGASGEGGAGAGGNPEPEAPMTEVDTPDQRTVEEVSDFLSVDVHSLIKTLIYRTSKGPVAVLVPGDRQANASKLFTFFGEEVEMYSPEEIESELGLPFGFVGPVGLDIRYVTDAGVAKMSNAVTGANKPGAHLTGVNPGRDFNIGETGDFQTVREGDPCPECGAPLAITRGIEAGHLFKLGTKYSVSMEAFYADEEGVNRPFIMGSYGIGVGRLMAATVEQHHDDRGIQWPASLAPFHVAVLPLAKEEPEVIAMAEDIYAELTAAGLEVLLDDRSDSAGVKFADADLIGIPFHVIVGKKVLSTGEVEMKERSTGERSFAPRADVLDAVLAWFQAQPR